MSAESGARSRLRLSQLQIPCSAELPGKFCRVPGVLVAFLSKNAGCPANFAGYPAFLNAFLSKIK